MIRVTDIIKRLWKQDEERFREWCGIMNEKYNKKIPLTPEKIQDWAAPFGTKMHKWCLEGVAPKKPTKMMTKCHELWEQFLKENEIEVLMTERKVLYEDLYHGTYDILVMWDNVQVLLDLKFWGCFYWVFLKKEIPESRGMTSTKLAKTNFQTYCYDQAQKDADVDARGVVAICPDRLQFKIFRRSPKDRFDEAMEELKKENKNDF